MPTKIYSYCTPSHETLLCRHLAPSVPAGFEIVVRRGPQACEAGCLLRPGWGTTMRAKIMMIRRALETETSPFVVSDADVRIYNLTPDDVLDMLGDGDVAFQTTDLSLPPRACAGFAFLRPVSRVVELYDEVLESLDMLGGSEQRSLCDRALPACSPELRVRYLPPSLVWCKAHEPGLAVGSELKAHHACGTWGVNAKIDELDAVAKARASA